MLKATKKVGPKAGWPHSLQTFSITDKTKKIPTLKHTRDKKKRKTIQRTKKLAKQGRTNNFDDFEEKSERSKEKQNKLLPVIILIAMN